MYNNLILNSLNSIHLFLIKDEKIRMDRKFSSFKLIIEMIKALKMRVNRIVEVLPNTLYITSIGNTFWKILTIKNLKLLSLWQISVNQKKKGPIAILKNSLNIISSLAELYHSARIVREAKLWIIKKFKILAKSFSKLYINIKFKNLVNSIKIHSSINIFTINL